MTLNKVLGTFALSWTVLLAILNIALIVLAIPSIFLGNGPRAMLAFLFFLALILIDLVLATPALAAEWLRSIRIAKARLWILQQRRMR